MYITFSLNIQLLMDTSYLGEATSHLRAGVVGLRSHPAPEARGGGREEQPEERWLPGRRRA